MANHVALDNITHKDLRIVTRRAAALGDDIAAATVFPIEFRALQADYPILFRKLADEGRYEPVAMLGFDRKENLFLRNGGWDAGYIPLSVERQPFLIGLDEANPDGEMTVHVDMDSPRISKNEGEPVFLEFGGVTPYLEHIRSVLLAIHQGHAANRALSAALTELNLLEPFVLDVELKDGVKRKLAGFHTVNEERLSKLDGAALGRLHVRAHLEAIYMAVASQDNFRKLIRWKNESR